MGIIGFNKTKIHAELIQPMAGKINIANNVAIKNVVEQDLAMGKNKQKVVRIEFDFYTKYLIDGKKEGAVIEVAGNVIFLDDPKKLKEYVAQWKKEKKMPKEIMGQVLNLVLTKCNIEALKQSEQFNLPPPIPLPKVNMEKKTQNYIG